MSHYKHLSIEEREKLYLMRGQGKSFREIGRELRRSASTLSATGSADIRTVRAPHSGGMCGISRTAGGRGYCPHPDLGKRCGAS